MADISKIRPEINFRDLGGIKTVRGRAVRPGILYRSGGLYRMNIEELEILKSLGIRAVLDLRTAEETEHKPDPCLPNVMMIRHSGAVFRGGEDIDFSPEGMRQMGDGGREQFEKIRYYYHEMPFDNEAFRILISRIENGDVPIVFHCASGKDRTGMAALILLGILGAGRSDALSDYALSNIYLKKDIEEAFVKYAGYAKADPIHEKLLHMEFGVLPGMGEEVFDAIIERYGSFERYAAKEYGMDDERLKAFREKCTVVV